MLQRLKYILQTVMSANDATISLMGLSNINVTDFNAMGHNLFQTSTYVPDSVSMLYVADTASNLDGIGQTEDSNSITPFMWMVVNASQSLNATYAPVNAACSMLDVTCQLGTLRDSGVFLNAVTRPWFQAVRAGRPRRLRVSARVDGDAP